MSKIKYTSLNGYKYRVAEIYHIFTGIITGNNVYYPSMEAPFVSLDENGLLTLYENYAIDGATDPAIDTETDLRGAFIHDGLYQLLRKGLLDSIWKDTVDKLFITMCREDGMSLIRSKYFYYALKYFGASASKYSDDKETQEIILEAGK